MNQDRLYTPTFFLVFTSGLLIGITFASNAVYPLYVEHSGGNANEIGWFMGIYGLTAIAGRPVIGMIIDRFGTRFMLLLAIALMTIPPLGFYLLLDKGLIIPVWILRAIQGLGNGGHFTAFFTFAAEEAPVSRRNEAIGLYGLSGIIAFAIGPYLGEKVVDGWGLGPFFLIMFGMGLLSWLAMVMVSSTHKKEGETGLPNFDGIIITMKSLKMWFVFVIAGLFAVSFSSTQAFIAPYSKYRGIEDFSTYFVAFGIFAFTIRIIGSKWGDKYGIRRILVPSLFAYVVALVIMSFADSPTLIFLSGAMAGLGHGLAFPLITTLGYNYAPKGYSGSSMALVTGMMDGGSALTAFALGALAEWQGYGIIFPIAAFGPFLAAMMLIVNILRNREVMKGKLAGNG